MAGVVSVETPARKDDLILVLNSGSSSLKFGIYGHGAGDEVPLLTGSAEGVGRSNGTLHIRSSGGELLVRQENILESQSDALTALAAVIRQHVHSTPAAVGHRVVHGGPQLCAHQLITPRVLDELRLATHFAPLHIPQALSLVASAQSIFPSAAHFACFDDAFHQTIPAVASSRSCITSAPSFPNEPSSRISVTEQASALFAIEYRSTPPWASLPPAGS